MEFPILSSLSKEVSYMHNKTVIGKCLNEYIPQICKLFTKPKYQDMPRAMLVGSSEILKVHNHTNMGHESLRRVVFLNRHAS
jgi:spore maturation protein CgeB